MKTFLQRRIYRLFRTFKAYILKKNPPIATKLFFLIQELLDSILHRDRKPNKFEISVKRLEKQIYHLKYPNGNLFEIITEHPVAKYSDDHKWPRGTLFDNSINYKFNQKLYWMMNYKSDMKIMDLGCSGGGFVKSILDDGYTAIGLEGSNASKKTMSAEWATCPYHLFTCDISMPFTVLEKGPNEQALFNVITSWEVLEHIPEDRIPNLVKNIASHLTEGGFFIASVALFPEANPIIGAVYHVTLKEKAWWLKKFSEAGFVEFLKHPFEIEDFVRGHGSGLTEWSPKDKDGFHLVLQLKSKN